MSNISGMELQNLRHLLLSCSTEEKKFASYAESAQDPQVKQFFEKSAQSATQNKQTYLDFLRQENRSMEEKVMVSDALNGINSCLTKYEEMITQTENQQLRQQLQQIRNQTETSQYELFTIAKSKGYYEPAEQATDDEKQTVKSIITSSSF